MGARSFPAMPYDGECSEAAVHWYAVFTMPRHEKSIARTLERVGIEHFLPVYDKLSLWQNRQKRIISLPLFPRYLFVRIGQRQRVTVLQTAGVVQIVCGGGLDLAVPDAEIAFLRDKVERKLVEPYPELAVGRRVCVKRGPMAGIEGVLVRRRNRTRFVVTLQMIRQSASVEVSAEDLEALKN